MAFMSAGIVIDSIAVCPKPMKFYTKILGQLNVSKHFMHCFNGNKGKGFPLSSVSIMQQLYSSYRLFVYILERFTNAKEYYACVI